MTERYRGMTGLQRTDCRCRDVTEEYRGERPLGVDKRLFENMEDTSGYRGEVIWNNDRSMVVEESGQWVLKEVDRYGEETSVYTAEVICYICGFSVPLIHHYSTQLMDIWPIKCFCPYFFTEER